MLLESQLIPAIVLNVMAAAAVGAFYVGGNRHPKNYDHDDGDENDHKDGKNEMKNVKGPDPNTAAPSQPPPPSSPKAAAVLNISTSTPQDRLTRLAIASASPR